jgi:hypothetical protein
LLHLFCGVSLAAVAADAGEAVLRYPSLHSNSVQALEVPHLHLPPSMFAKAVNLGEWAAAAPAEPLASEVAVLGLLD